MRVLVGLLAAGFIAALVFSWVFERTPAGYRRDDKIPAAESIAPQTARRMDRMIIVVLLLAVGYFAVDKFVLAPAWRSQRPPTRRRLPAQMPLHPRKHRPHRRRAMRSPSPCSPSPISVRPRTRRTFPTAWPRRS
jgi:hypothetical protein